MPPGLRPEATPETVVHHMRMMYDIMALATNLNFIAQLNRIDFAIE